MAGQLVLSYSNTQKHYSFLDNTILMTDEYRGYLTMKRIINHLSINHSKEYANGIIHTNTIESFWNFTSNICGTIDGIHILGTLAIISHPTLQNRKKFDSVLFVKSLQHGLNILKCLFRAIRWDLQCKSIPMLFFVSKFALEVDFIKYNQCN